MSAEKIISEWKEKIFKPVYWLEGEEPYFIDKIIHFAEHHILSNEAAGFNLTIFYGKDADWPSIVNACRKYPMFSDRQIVILKEAQQMKDVEKLEPYVQKPLASTILIIGYKDKKLDGRSSFAKLVKKTAYLNSEKIKDYQLAEWTSSMIQNKKLDISPKALMLLLDHIGNDLTRLENEIEKLSLNLKERKNITEEDIETFIGISKEFNVFELENAIAKRDLAKAIRIVQYFEANPKAAPIQFILPALYGYFSKVYSTFGMQEKSEQAVKVLFYNNSFAAKQALQTAANYSIVGIEKILLLLHQYNLKSIGINSNGTGDSELMKELVAKIIMN